jgi:hydroxypyruvate isomerase
MNESRRNMLKNLMGGAAAISATPLLTSFDIANDKTSSPLKGNINHSACRWCYNSIPIEELCAAAKKIGLKGIDLVGPKDWPVLKKYGLYSSMCNGAEINLVDGFNDKQFHDTLVKNYTEYIPEMKKAGYEKVICFSGSRRGKDDETGLTNCVEALKRILPVAEKHDVMVVMELLNSKVDHKDYQCDKSPWGVELVKRVGSEHFALLYDIYHMQIDEGDVIRTIKENHKYFVHYHTGGVPGRHEIDESQELYYPAIMKAILETGFKGFVAQEFIPSKEDKNQQLAALEQGVRICDV